MTRDEFQKDLKESVGVISDIIGDKVNYFRAPGFSYNQIKNTLLKHYF